MDRDRQEELPKLQVQWIDGVCKPLFKVGPLEYLIESHCQHNDPQVTMYSFSTMDFVSIILDPKLR